MGSGIITSSEKKLLEEVSLFLNNIFNTTPGVSFESLRGYLNIPFGQLPLFVTEDSVRGIVARFRIEHGV